MIARCLVLCKPVYVCFGSSCLLLNVARNSRNSCLTKRRLRLTCKPVILLWFLFVPFLCFVRFFVSWFVFLLFPRRNLSRFFFFVFSSNRKYFWAPVLWWTQWLRVPENGYFFLLFSLWSALIVFMLRYLLGSGRASLQRCNVCKYCQSPSWQVVPSERSSVPTASIQQAIFVFVCAFCLSVPGYSWDDRYQLAWLHQVEAICITSGLN